MTPRAMVNALQRLGIEMRVSGDSLVLSPPGKTPPDLLAEAKRLKPELLALLRSETANANGAGPGLLPPSDIVGLVAAIGAADPIEVPDRVREAAALMRRAGHARAEIASTLLPAAPIATVAIAARLALEDGWTDAEAEAAP